MLTGPSALLATLAVSLITVGIAAWLLLGYYRKKLTIVEVLLYGLATQGYHLALIGPTINAFFLVSTLFLVHEVWLFSQKTIRIHRRYLLLLGLPLISSLIGVAVYTYDFHSFYHNPVSDLYFYTKPIYFYAKNYLPLFAIGYKLYRHRSDLTLPHFFATVERIVRYSCYLALAQLGLTLVTGSGLLAELLGDKARYMLTLPNGLTFIRVSAAFNEPKNLAAFLGLALPWLVLERKIRLAWLAGLVGLLTMSQTFTLECLMAVFLFVLLRPLRQVRPLIVGTMVLVVAFFLTLSTARDALMNSAAANRDAVLFALVAERAIQRFEEGGDDEQAEILGIPFQKDLEWPVVKFLFDRPDVLLTGYGPGNSNFIPPSYFLSIFEYKYEEQLTGRQANHMNMRWLFYSVEFGLPVFLVFWWVLTSVRSGLPVFARRYFAFLWVCLFFNEVEIVLIVFYMLLQYGPVVRPKAVDSYA
ncbi:hypothetical protein [Tellurirhabdus rosea]|uniref:hypothetical protein n=1 Tax=Tellurirhabdus rosea TaxID=2674997 RepID=UPI0022536F4B|nr:hypothetical protein [Tellurirhabdus rosea]